MKLTSIALAAALGLSATASFAQAPPPPGAPAPGGERHWQRPDPAQIQQRRAEMAQRHAQHLRDALQLTPAQEPALQAFMASMQPPPGERERGPGERGKRDDRGPNAQPLSTPERLDRMQAKMAERAQRFQAHAVAVKRFYASLTPPQQKAFDAMPPMMMGGRHGGHGHGRGGPDGFRGGPGGPGGFRGGPA
jgi:hypothetical protein